MFDEPHVFYHIKWIVPVYVVTGGKFLLSVNIRSIMRRNYSICVSIVVERRQNWNCALGKIVMCTMFLIMRLIQATTSTSQFSEMRVDV